MICGHCKRSDVNKEHVKGCSATPLPVQQARRFARSSIVRAGLEATAQRQSKRPDRLKLRPGEKPF